jgi:hypothetical protein
MQLLRPAAHMLADELLGIYLRVRPELVVTQPD